MSTRRVKCFIPAVAALAVAIWCSGTAAATYTSQEEANIKVVTGFYAALDQGDASGDLKQRIRSIAEQYLRADYIQHREGARKFGAGREGFIRMFEQMPSMPPPSAPGAPPAPKVLALMANGDLVVRISSREAPAPDGKEPSTLYIYNMFRIQDGKLAEHWDGSSAGAMMGPGQMPPKAGAPSPGAALTQPPPKQ